MTEKEYIAIIQVLTEDNIRLREENARLIEAKGKKGRDKKANSKTETKARAKAKVENRNRKYPGFGEEHTNAEWAELFGLRRNATWRYFQRGFTVEEIAEIRGIKYAPKIYSAEGE